MSDTEEEGAFQKRSILQPSWVDLTPRFDPTGRASELEILEDSGIDLASFSVQLHWHPGSVEKATRFYFEEMWGFGLPSAEVGECWTTLSVYEGVIYITCFLPDDVYAGLMAMCEGFAQWPGPKAYIGKVIMPLLHEGLYAALNRQTFMAFMQGTVPLYSSSRIVFGVSQNHDIP